MMIGIKSIFSDVPGVATDFSELSAGKVFNDFVLPRVQAIKFPDAEEQADEFESANMRASEEREQRRLFDFQRMFAQEREDDAFLRSVAPIDETQSSTGVVSPNASNPPGASLSGSFIGSKDLLSLVKGFEGWNPNAYGDFKQTSIGYGTRAKPGEKSITKEEGERRLLSELSMHRNRVLSLAKQAGYQFSESQVDALTSFDYNTGRLEQLTDNGKRDIPTIAKMMLQYNKAGGKRLEGLARRRAAEMRVFLEGY